MAETTDYTDLSQYPAGHFDQFFYFSSMYSDKLLTEFLPKVKNQAYERYMQIQKNILNDTEKHTTANLFEKNPTLSNLLGFPVNSRYWQIPGLELPIANKLLFARTYGAGTVIIPGLDFYTKHTIFSQVFRFMIGDYYCDHYYVIKDKYGNTYVAIKDDSTDGISESVFDSLGDAPVFLWKDKHSAIYQASMIPSISLETINNRKVVKIPYSAALTGFQTPYTDNSWDICVAPEPTTKGTCLSYMAQATLQGVDSDYLYLIIPDEFASMVTSIPSSTKFTAIHRPNRRYSYKYTATNDEEPILYLAEDGHPIPASNIKLYAYDASTAHRKYRISLDGISPKFFPAIYDFTNLVASDDLFIEIIDYDKTTTNTSFTNHFQMLIDMLGSDEYRNSLVNGELSNYPNIVGYDPKIVEMSHNEFLASGYGIREYKLRKLLELMQSDPWIYQEYIKFMDKINLRIITEAGTPKHFKLNTSLSRDGLSYNLGPVVNDTSSISYLNHDDTVYFTESHTYLKVHCENPNAYVRVYVNGALIVPSAIESVGNDIYIFIAQSVLCTLLEPYDQDNSLDISNSQLVIAEIFPKIDRNNANLLQDSKTWGTTGDFLNVFEDYNDIKVSINDLVFVNSTSGEILDRSQFDFEFTLDEAVLEYDDGTQQTIRASKGEVIYLMTNAGELWVTQDEVPIILDTHSEDVVPEFDSEGVSGTGVITSIEDIVNKQYNISDIKIAINDPTLVGTDVIIMVSRKALEWNISSENSDHFNYDGNNIVVNAGGFVGSPTATDRIEVYAKGTLLSPDDYSLALPTNINDDFNLSINDVVSGNIMDSGNVEIEIRYIPMNLNQTTSITTLNTNKLTSEDIVTAASSFGVVNDDTMSLNGLTGKFVCKWFDENDNLMTIIPSGAFINDIIVSPLSRVFLKYAVEPIDQTDGVAVYLKDLSRDADIKALVPGWFLTSDLIN